MQDWTRTTVVSYHVVLHGLSLVSRNKRVFDANIYWRPLGEVSLQSISEDIPECHHRLTLVTRYGIEEIILFCKMRGLISQWMVNEHSGVAACCHKVCTGAFRSAVPQPEEAYFCLRLFLSFEVVWKVTEVQRALEVDDLSGQFWSSLSGRPS